MMSLLLILTAFHQPPPPPLVAVVLNVWPITLLRYSALVPLTPFDIVEVYAFAFFDIDGSNYTASASVTVKLSSKGRLINLFRTPML